MPITVVRVKCSAATKPKCHHSKGKKRESASYQRPNDQPTPLLRDGAAVAAFLHLIEAEEGKKHRTNCRAEGVREGGGYFRRKSGSNAFEGQKMDLVFFLKLLCRGFQGIKV